MTRDIEGLAKSCQVELDKFLDEPTYHVPLKQALFNYQVAWIEEAAKVVEVHGFNVEALDNG